MTNELLNFLSKYTHHFSNLCKVNCNVFDVNLKEIQGDSFCKECNCCDYKNAHKYGCFEAQRWNGKYIYYCRAGFIFIAVVLIDDLNRIDAGVLAGPVVMGNIEDFIQENTISISNVPNFETSIVNDMAEIMAAVFTKKESTYNSEYENLLNDIYKVRDILDEKIYYPIDLEKQLQTAISDGDSDLSKELLNKLLGHIFFCSNGDFKTIKARVVELMVLLSRSAIDGGADLDQIFLLNKNYIEEVEALKTIEQLSIWLSGIINRFVGYVFEFNDVKHADVLFKAMNYIKQNYKEKLSLDDICANVYLSKSYLSKIFKDEMKCTLTNYISSVRVEKSKSLLLDNSLSLADVASMVGFEDQSYYTKVFKKNEGVSPGKYKSLRGKKEAKK
ncbi:MAG: AraC family transcriptional regulator [Bacillota bacterium]|nr:AraC family transcriptional regulator [Bacillota bacterium]